MNQCDQFQSMIYSMLESMVVLMVEIRIRIPYFYLSCYLALQATVVTLRELKQYISDGDNNDTFIVQCFLSHFDLDGPLNQVITKRW